MSKCIEWPHSIRADGYGQQWYEGRMTGAHRVAYVNHHNLTLADIDGKIIRHTCDNRKCINPYHLLVGSHRDNMEDMTSRGRQARGSGHGRVKLTAEQVAAVRKEYVPKSPTHGGTALAQRYGVSKGQISRVVNGTRWKETPDT